MLEDLADHRYLMRAYALASDSWTDFRATGKQTSLFEVAAILCGAWSELSENEDFFQGLDDARERIQALETAQPSAQSSEADAEAAVRDEFHRHLEVDRLLSRELVVLVQAGMDPAHAVRLVTDLTEVLGDRLSPDLPKLGRQDASKLAQELCRAQERLRTFEFDPEVELPAGRPPDRGWLRHFKPLGRGLRGLGGAATIAGNAVATITGPGLVTGLGLASIVGGAEVLWIAVRR